MITVQKKKKKKESWSVINTESTSFLIPIDDHHLQDGLIIISTIFIILTDIYNFLSFSSHRVQSRFPSFEFTNSVIRFLFSCKNKKKGRTQGNRVDRNRKGFECRYAD